jgi:hypothetical protein
MPAPIVGGLVSYLQEELEASVWDGEIPLTDTNGNVIVPGSGFPVIRVIMTEDGLTRDWNCGVDPYADQGIVIIQVWDISRTNVMNALNSIETLLSSASNWGDIPLAGGASQNPYYIVDLTMEKWTAVQEEGLRMQSSQLLYRGQFWYNCIIHGAISTS